MNSRTQTVHCPDDFQEALDKENPMDLEERLRTQPEPDPFPVSDGMGVCQVALFDTKRNRLYTRAYKGRLNPEEYLLVAEKYQTEHEDYKKTTFRVWYFGKLIFKKKSKNEKTYEELDEIMLVAYQYLKQSLSMLFGKPWMNRRYTVVLEKGDTLERIKEYCQKFNIFYEISGYGDKVHVLIDCHLNQKDDIEKMLTFNKETKIIEEE